MDTATGNSPPVPAAGRKTIPYETSRSDTLQAIALKFNMPVSEVMRLNNLRSSSIFPGQQLVVYEPLARRSEPARPSASQPIQVPTNDVGANNSPPNSASTASPPAADLPRRFISPGSDTDLSITPSPSPYAGGEVPIRARVPFKSGISRHHQAKSLPLLSRLRHERDRKYAFETVAGDDLLATMPHSHITGAPHSAGGSRSSDKGPFSTSPPSGRRTSSSGSMMGGGVGGSGGSSFATFLPDEYRLTERDVLKEHVRYFISEQKNMLGELTVTPAKVIFEPELDDPMTRELGLIRSHFQCDMANVIDVHILDAAEVVAAWRSKLTRVDGDFALPGSPPSSSSPASLDSDAYERALDFSGVDAGTLSDTRPRFIQLAVMASSSGDSSNKNVDTGRIVYFLINRVAAEVFNRKLHEWMHSARTTAKEQHDEKQLLKRSGSISTPLSPKEQPLQRRSSVSSLSASAKQQTSGAQHNAAAASARPTRVSLDGSAIPIPHSKGSSGETDRELSTSAPATNWGKYDDAADTALHRHNSAAAASGHRRQPSSTAFIGPTLKDISVILQTPEIQRKLASILPTRYRNCEWQLLYSTARHGVSLNTFYMKTRNRGPSVMIVEDTEGYVFGGFVSESWEPRKGFYGTGESLLFSLFPAFNVYPWSGLNDYFMFAREDQLAIGGGGGKFGLWLDSEFLQGASAPCDTFLNSCLASQEYFQCSVMECWGFEPDS
eukprot:TRINITY_DN5639_c0_g2_i1.p1 TRINITY_DN5639_c0_g2~~TRINITY_DN5639_c0_g2_i1.p1  ORF type:complete len:723 (-),score=94.45 TRINITY_DN5639_c0_g2_i1:3-2171(-)